MGKRITTLHNSYLGVIKKKQWDFPRLQNDVKVNI